MTREQTDRLEAVLNLFANERKDAYIAGRGGRSGANLSTQDG